MGNWNYKEYTMNKIESVQDEKTIFFPLDLDLDVRYILGNIYLLKNDQDIFTFYF